MQSGAVHDRLDKPGRVLVKRSSLVSLLAVVAFATAALLATASTSVASVTIGQLAPGSPTPACGGDLDRGQLTVTSGNSYIVPSGGGVLTSWRHNATAGDGQTLTMKVFRKLADPATYLVVAEDLRTLTPSTINTFSTRIQVQAGDILGHNGESTPQNACIFDAPGDTYLRRSPGLPAGQSGMYEDPNAMNFRLNIEASLEPDADRDGFGDETQDQCPTDAATQGTCPAAVTPKREDPKCKRLRKKLHHWQQRKLAMAGTETKQAYIQDNIEDTKRRLKKRGCK
jgi:hypothetical protein